MWNWVFPSLSLTLVKRPSRTTVGHRVVLLRASMSSYKQKWLSAVFAASIFSLSASVICSLPRMVSQGHASIRPLSGLMAHVEAAAGA